MAVVTMHLINNDIGPQTLKSRVGDVFTLGMYVYPKAGNTGGGTLKLVLYCTDSTGHSSPTTVTAATETVPAVGSWTYLTGTATVPTGYDTVDPQLTMTSVPVTDYIFLDDALVREVTAAQNILDEVYNVLSGSSTANNSLASLGSQFTTWLTNLFGGGSTVASTTVAPAAIPGLSASKITSGTFPQTMVTGLSTFISNLLGPGTGAALVGDLQSVIDDMNKAVTGSSTTNNSVSTFLTNVSNWVGSLFGVGQPVASTITPAAVPALSATKITSGNLSVGVLPTAIPSTNIPALGAQLSPNLVLDPDFESTTLWTGATGTQDTVQAHSGTHSWQLQGAG